MNKYTSLLRKFLNRIRRGDVVNALYLSYYYTYIIFYDFINKTNFANSQTPDSYTGEWRQGSTGNFPAHPRIVKMFLIKSGLNLNDPIIDIGHGSGLALHIAHAMGFNCLAGIEHGDIPYQLSKANLPSSVNLIHGDAFEIDLSKYKGLFFLAHSAVNLRLASFKDCLIISKF